MKIYINGRFLTQKLTGVQRYAVEVVKCLSFYKGFELVLLVPKDYSGVLEFNKICIHKVGFLSGHLWEQLELPFYSRNGLLINLCNASPLFKREQIVTIHDASVFGFPSAYSYLFRTWYKFLLKASKYNAKKVFTVSRFSKSELEKHCGIPEEKIEAVYLGHEHVVETISNCNIIDKNGLQRKKYVLAVSSMNPNKNFMSIINAFNMLSPSEYCLVIAGGFNSRVFEDADVVLPTSVKHVGYVSDAELKALYENAGCFIFPSYYEGFGLPPLEAMACGCPVIVANSSSLPEVCGEAALYCNPYDIKDISQKINLLMNNQELRRELRRKGLMRVTQFTWEKCAQKLYNQILEGK